MDKEIGQLKETTHRIEKGLDRVQETQGTTDKKLRLMLVRMGVEDPDPDDPKEMALARAAGLQPPAPTTPRTQGGKRKDATPNLQIDARYLVCGPQEPPMHAESWAYTRVKLLRNINDDMWELQRIESDGRDIGKPFKTKAPILAMTEEDADHQLAQRIGGKR